MMMDLRIRGVLICKCNYCGVFFSVSMIPNISCPGCKGSDINRIGDGITTYNEPKKEYVYVQPEAPPSTTNPKGKEFLRVEDLMEILDISQSTAYNFMNDPDFPSMNLGTIKRVRREAFYKWLLEKENKPL